MTRKSQKEVEDLLNIVESYTVDSLSDIQATAYNYLVDYVELGDNGIDQSHEGNRLYNLCIDIVTQYLWDHGWRPKNSNIK